MTPRAHTEPMDWERPSERFLAYLGRLSAACLAKDREELERLLRMRLSSHLPRAVLDELEYFRRATPQNLRAPLKLMRYVHKMQQLASAPADEEQMPLALRERDVTAPVGDGKARRRTIVTRDGGES